MLDAHSEKIRWDTGEASCAGSRGEVNLLRFVDVLQRANTMPAAALTPAAWKKARDSTK